MVKKLTLDALIKLIAAFDLGYEEFNSVDNRELNGIAAYDLLDFFGCDPPELWEPWMERVGYSIDITHILNGKYESDRVDYRSGRDMVRIRNLNVKKPFIPISRVGVYRVNEHLLLRDISQRLNLFVTKALEQSVLLPDHLWMLGVGSLGGDVALPIYLARALDLVERDVVEALAKYKAHGLVLVTNEEAPDLLRWPPGIEGHSVIDVLEGRSLGTSVAAGLSLNTYDSNTLLKKKVSSRQPILNRRGEVLIDYDNKNKILHLNGKPPWYIKGDVRAEVVEYLYHQAINGFIDASTKNILSSSRVRGYGGSRSIPAIFKGCNSWRKYLDNPRRGYWGFNVLWG